MAMPTSRIPAIILFILALATLALAGPAENGPDLFKNIAWRHIGPTTCGGRIPDIEAVPGNPSVVYVSGSTGGIFKSVNQGLTWTPIFDEAGNSVSIGDMALAPSDPDLIWVGTGEANCDQNAGTMGDGVYKSLDGGKTWQNMGLRDTHHIGRLRIHPTNPDIVYVAAAGHLWGPNEERGLFRTRDGGRTWEKVLYINADTGVTDVAMDPNGRILYAAAYQRRRTAWGIADGGPHSGIWRSLDGGDTWVQLTKGLPSGELEKIGLAVAPSAPHIVYAIIGHREGGVFRSEDRGDTWTRVNKMRSPGYWYGQIMVDPVNPDKVWVPGVQLAVSIDGGKNFETDWTARNIHVDHHALWVNPHNPDHQYLGNDGGFYVTWDNGRNWDFRDNLPIAQYYAIGLDTRDPYWIYGGLQDNGTWGIPSMTYNPRGIVTDDTICVAWGDGFYAAIDPTDPTTLYAESQYGVLQRVSLKPRQSKMIQPVPEDPEEKYRFSWNSPLIISPHDPQRIYFGGNKLFTTTNGGQSWTVISPDLTRNLDKKDATIMGVKASLRAYSTITTVSESPVRAGLIYVGTDDGQLQVTRDGGRNWENLSDILGLAEKFYTTRVLASAHDADVAFASFSAHYEGDYAPYLFRTDDGGKTWRNIGAAMPAKTVVKALAEHPRNASLLFAGVHYGLLFSLDAGRTWYRAGGNLPAVPVDDLAIEPRENDLVLGTYGRGLLIMDDITFLEKLTPEALDREVVLFPPPAATQYIPVSPVPTEGDEVYAGPNPEYGAMITYYLKTDPPAPAPKKEEPKAAETAAAAATPPSGPEKASHPEKPATPSPVKLVITDSAGQVVRELEGPDKKGFHRISWDLCLEHPLAGEEGRRQYRGPLVVPGEYTVKLTARDQETSATFVVRADPEARAAAEDLQARLAASLDVVTIQQATFEARRTLRQVEQELQRVQKMLGEVKEPPESLQKTMKEALQSLKEVKEKFAAGGGWVEAGLLWQVQSSTAAPSQSDRRRIRNLRQRAIEQIGALNGLISGKFLELQKGLAEHDIAAKAFTPVTPPKAEE